MRIVEGIKNTEDEEDESWYTEGNDKTMAAMGILKTIATLVYSVEGSKDVSINLFAQRRRSHRCCFNAVSVRCLLNWKRSLPPWSHMFFRIALLVSFGGFCTR